MKNIKIGVKLMASYILMAVVAIAIGIYMTMVIGELNERDHTLYEKVVVPLSDMPNMVRANQRIRINFRDVLIAKSTAEVDKLKAESANWIDSLTQKAVAQKAAVLDPTNLARLDAVVENAKKYLTTFNDFADFAKKNINNKDLVQEVYPKKLEEGRVFSDVVTKNLNEYISTKTSFAEKMSIDNVDYAGNARNIAITLLIILFVFSLTAGIFMTYSITGPLKKVVNIMQKGEKGDMTVRADINQKDELGIMADAVNRFFESLQKIIMNLRADSETVASSSEELSSVSRQLASGSEETVSQSHNVASTSEEMAVNINSMASAAEQASVSANEVAGAAEQMSTNMNTVAAAIEEMSSSISQIATNAGEARRVAGEATEKSRSATNVMDKLGIAAKEIGQVTDVIKKIADKTNLLALNATIEAASAGEAGKGFAVVAGEIKELANQSAQSADDIARRIEGIQAGTGDAVEVINDVSDIIVKINQSVEAIAGHVEQQTKASNEIASNVSQANIGSKRVASAIGEVAKGANDVSRNSGEAAKGAKDVSRNISDVSKAAKDSARGALQVSQASGDLSKVVSNLKDTVGRFKV